MPCYIYIDTNKNGVEELYEILVCIQYPLKQPNFNRMKNNECNREEEEIATESDSHEISHIEKRAGV